VAADAVEMLGGRELLRELLHSRETLEPVKWREPPPDPPSLRVRYARISALARALRLGTVEEVVEGRFLARADPKRYANVIDSILANGESDGPHRADRDHPIIWVTLAYRSLLSFRFSCEQVLSFNRGLLKCGSELVGGVIREQTAVNKGLRSSLTRIDEWLVGFLDPEGRAFSLHELVSQYGYPDVDVAKMERNKAWGIDD
jgi:hypothetical protein